MLTLQKTGNASVVSVSTDETSLNQLLSTEWLLTNGRGGYASSTVAGCNTRGYHGLLIGTLNPPVNRVVALANCLETEISQQGTYNLSTFEFYGKFAPEGFVNLKQFRQDTGVHFDYELDGVELTKSLYLLRETDTVAIVYNFTNIREPLEFITRPFVGLRDFHSMQKSSANLISEWSGEELVIKHDIPNSCRLHMSCPAAAYEKDAQWWFNFYYRAEAERGQNCNEDLWTPGFFKYRIDSPTQIVLWARLEDHKNQSDGFGAYTIDKVQEDLQTYRKNLLDNTFNPDKKWYSFIYSPKSDDRPLLETLCLAADHFIVDRKANNTKKTTILAGYPWFADWGRDTFISLPGLLLSTRRFNEARDILTTFASVADEGMIPSRFDDYNGTTCFNSIDASLWFINAAFEYLQVTNDTETFSTELLPTIRWIADSYQRGTRFGIHADTDGLITAGNTETQLTWMDAKYNAVAFTPRYGKAVEVNALWYNCLYKLAKFYEELDKNLEEKYKSMAETVKESFCRLFWNESLSYLNDCILPDGSVDASIRPNQIFAVSLEYSPLSEQQQKAVVETVQNHLLTEYGLRTLNQSSPQYQGKYTGPQQQRDQAYHQGTVWPYLIGPFVESYLKVNQYSQESKEQAAEFIRPLLEHLNQSGCLGSVAEIYDGDDPGEPKGCFAQAWSVAELIRAYLLVNS